MEKFRNIKYFFIILFLQFYLSGGIIGGWWKSVRNYPYLVLIIYEVPDVCCGSIIMTSWILTAARCVHHAHVGANRILGIKVGVTTIEKDPGKLVRKRSIHVHPHFLSDASYALSVNDIALIQLVKHLEFGPHVHPVGVGFQKLVHNTSCVTMGWGVINPNVYLTGQVKDAAFWPVKGKNSLRDIDQQTSTKDNLYECKRLMKDSYKESIHLDYHICAIHYPYGKKFRDPTAPVWTNDKKKRQDYGGENVWNDTKYFFDKDWKWKIYVDDSYDVIRVNTDGPSYYDYGAPLVCYGQQVGIFIFPVANVKLWRPAAAAVYTMLFRYLDWIDTVIEIELNKQENSPPARPDTTHRLSIWDILNGSKSFVSHKIIIAASFTIVILLY